MKKLIIVLILVILLLVPVSCTSTTPQSEEEEAPLVVLERWEIGEKWEYGQQAVWGDIMVGSEIEVRDRKVVKPYISTYNLRSREKERVLELPPDRIVYDAPAIHGDRVVWASVNRDEAEQQRSVRHSPMPNWDVFLLDIKTGEVRQLTTDDRAQVYPRIYGDTVVWLDNRHEEGYHNPRRYDVYAYDLRSNKESRITSTTSAEDRNLSISGNLVSWTDNRHADPEVNIHAGNEPDYNNEIYAYDLAANKEHRVTDYAGNDHYPAIDGNRIVWLRQSEYREADVFVYDVETGQETQVSHSSYASFRPAIHGDKIVWTDARASKGNTTNDVVEIVVDQNTGTKERREPGADIYLYDLKAQREKRLTSPLDTGFSLWVRPLIHNNFIVYMLDRQVNPITYAMRLTEK